MRKRRVKSFRRRKRPKSLTFRRRISMARGPKKTSDRYIMGIPVVVVGFALVGYGLMNLDATVLFVATLVFFIGLLIMLVLKR